MRKFFTVNGLVISNDVRNFSNKYNDIFFRKKTKKLNLSSHYPNQPTIIPLGYFRKEKARAFKDGVV